MAQTKSTRLEYLLILRRQEFIKTEDLFARLYMDWKNGDIDHKQYREIKEKFEKQKAKRKNPPAHQG